MQNDPGIFYTVLAVSARHLEATRGSQYWYSNEYERECLRFLIPTLNGINARERLQNEAMMVSALLLRLLDEMTGACCIIASPGTLS